MFAYMYSVHKFIVGSTFYQNGHSRDQYRVTLCAIFNLLQVINEKLMMMIQSLVGNS